MQVCHSTITIFATQRKTHAASSKPHTTCHVCAPSPRPSCKQPTQNHGRATTLDTERHMNQAARAPNSIQQAPREKQQHTRTHELHGGHTKEEQALTPCKTARRRATQVDFQHKHMMHTCTHKHHAGLPLNHGIATTHDTERHMNVQAATQNRKTRTQLHHLTHTHTHHTTELQMCVEGTLTA